MANLITAKEVIELAFAENSNMREESISDTSIRIAEIKHIKPVFGNMYSMLGTTYADFTNEYIKPALAYFVKCEIVSSIAIDMSNSGVAIANPQYQSAASDKQRQRLYDSEMGKAKVLLDDALAYISAHAKEFPDYEGVAPKRHYRNGGLILGNGVPVKPTQLSADSVSRKEFDALEGRVEDLEQGAGGGGNSDNNYTDADKELVDKIPELEEELDNKVDTTTFDETIRSIGEGIEEVGNSVAEALKNKADKDGYYPSMSVGMADNLVGRGDVQDAHINFRPSAGADNITDGAARIERIKGNSVVYNQLWENGKGSWTATRVDLTEEGGRIKITSTTPDGGKSYKNLYYPITVGHKVAIELYANVNGKVRVGAYSGATADQAYMGALEGDGTLWQTYTVVQLTTNVSTFGFYIAKNGDSIEFDEDSIRIVDLTKEFGAGNEPTTVEKYRQRKPMNIEDEYAYNAGELVDMHADKLVSTSDNAYDYTKLYARVMGGYKYDITANAGATLVVSFYADGEDDNEEREIAPDSEGKYTFPANGICHVNGAASHSDVCVCLNHSYDKPHPAYQQEVKDLSFISEAFPEGMRSAGSTYDEIRFNPTKKVWEKVERVGVRAYAEGDAEDSSVTTDGKTTNYPLDNPTPTTIDLSPNFNLDYLVWDFGTEEAIVPNNVPSAPFRADINYKPNAVDDLRWAVSEIRSLKAQLAQMQTSTTNLTE